MATASPISGSLMAASQAVAEDGIGADQREAAQAEGKKQKIEHGAPPELFGRNIGGSASILDPEFWLRV